MKLHRNIALGIMSALEITLLEKRNAKNTLKKLLKSNPNWGSKDRRIIAKIFYDIVRQKRLFEVLTGDENSASNFWNLIGCWMVLNNQMLPKWDEFKDIDDIKIKSKIKTFHNERKYRYSIPDWLDEMGEAEFGENIWEKEMAALNTPADLIIRVNTLKTSISKLKDLLEKKYNLITHLIPNYPEALRFEKNQSLQRIKEYRDGWFEVQDANSQKIAPWLEPESGKYYIDACAGAGGKSLHLANLTYDSAKILALDINNAKLKELKKRCCRNNYHSINIKNIEHEEILKSIDRNADGVLIDAPCSGLGVIKRNPCAKWNISQDRLTEILDMQEKILQTYAPMVKKGGIIVYATCSIMPLENSLQVFKFLNSELGSRFELDSEKTYFSHETGFDGFYCARLINKM